MFYNVLYIYIRNYKDMKTIKLNERELTRLIRNVVMEQPSRFTQEEQKCLKNMPDLSRPVCSTIGIKSGRIFASTSTIFLQYLDESNCPKLCRVGNDTKVTIS